LLNVKTFFAALADHAIAATKLCKEEEKRMEARLMDDSSALQPHLATNPAPE